MSRRVLQLSFLAAIVAAIWIGKPYFDKWQADRARIGEERSHQIAEERRQASLAIVLPTGVREQWIQALDRAMDERLLLYKGRLRIPNDLTNGYTYVLPSNLQVSCDTDSGVWLTSPDAEEGIALLDPHGRLGGPTTFELLRSGAIDDSFRPELERDVKDSPAAGNLMDEICCRVLDRITSLNRDSRSSRSRNTESD